MNVINAVTIDLNKPRKNVVHLGQGDNTHQISLTILSDGLPYDVTADAGGATINKFVKYIKANGVDGSYDTTSTGVTAVVAGSASNKWTVTLDEHATDYPGFAEVFVVFATGSGKVLHSFPITVDVVRTTSGNTDPGEPYYNNSGFVMVANQTAKTSAMTQRVGIDGVGRLWVPPGEGGLSSSAATLLISILQNGLYVTDETANILALDALLHQGQSVSVTYALTGVSSSNTSASITTGSSYSTTLTVSDPTYTMTSVSVVMSGLDITSTAYNASTGEISIGAVSGNITITASAEYIAILYNWDLTNSLTDTVGNVTAITNATQNSSGVTFSAIGNYIAFNLASVNFKDKTIEIDISSASTYNGSGSYHGRLVAFSTNATYKTDTSASTLCWHKSNSKWQFYLGSGWDANYISGATGSYFAGKTLRIYVSSTGIATLSVSTDGTTFTDVLTSGSALSYTTGLIMGSSGADLLTGIVVTGVRVYEGERS